MVSARAPWGKNEFIRLFANPQTIRGLVDDRLNAKIGEYCGLVHGNCLEIASGGGQVEGGTNGLIDATALFRGLRRPRIGEGLDERVYVYALNPPRTYVYPNKIAGAPSPAEKPYGAVFVVYAEISDTVLTDYPQLKSMDSKEHPIRGIVHFWEWLLAQPDEGPMPLEHSKRYSERIW